MRIYNFQTKTQNRYQDIDLNRTRKYRSLASKHLKHPRVLDDRLFLLRFFHSSYIPLYIWAIYLWAIYYS